jgi:xanthine dehydrogenase YagR molybdenum-binding subunit
MDELAYKLDMDPLELRLVNYTDIDLSTNHPFTEKNLRECYKRASEKFGWTKRSPRPRSMRDGDELIGWGMATETYPGKNLPCSAFVRFETNGRLTVGSGTQEIGTGNYTIMTQVAAATLGLNPHLIDPVLGDTKLPKAPISAGSMSTASLTPAVKAAAEDARNRLFALATNDAQSPFHGMTPNDLRLVDGKIVHAGSPARSESFTTLIARNGSQPVTGNGHIEPTLEKDKYVCHSFGAVFVEAGVNERTMVARVRRVVAVFDTGKIVNAKTAHSQFVGGIVWGISLALLESSDLDARYGRFTNENLAEYHVPTNLDIPEIHVSALDIPDMKLDSIGARGIGEIGITGTGAAVSNAVYHATGKRVRDLPITVDKLIA